MPRNRYVNLDFQKKSQILTMIIKFEYPKS